MMVQELPSKILIIYHLLLILLSSLYEYSKKLRQCRKTKNVTNSRLLHSSEKFLHTLCIVMVLTTAGTQLTGMWLAIHIISVYQLDRMRCWSWGDALYMHNLLPRKRVPSRLYPWDFSYRKLVILLRCNISCHPPGSYAIPLHGNEVTNITIVRFCPFFVTHHLLSPPHFWDITLCSLVHVCRYFGTVNRFNLQASSINLEGETDRLSPNMGK
jgi:hypothetical protein